MRKNNIIRLIIFGIVLMLFGCSEDLFDDISQKNKRDYKIKEVSISELSLNQGFTKAYSKISKSNFEIQISTTNKTQIENDYGFTIIDEPAKVIEYDNKTSYSLLIKTDSTQTNEIKNLVIEVDSLNESTNFIITYKLDESSENHINTNEQIVIEEIAFDPNTNISSRYNSDCMDVIVIYCSDASKYCGGADTQHGCYRRTTTICSASGASDFGASENVLTSPVDINHGHGGGGESLEESLITPCDDLTSKDSNAEFSTKMTELKTKASNQNFESAFTMYQNASLGLLFSNEQVGNPNDLYTGGQVELNINNDILSTPYNSVGFIHCHLDNGSTFGVFSFSDILGFSQLAGYSTRPVVEFGLYVTSASGTFAIKIKNKIAFKNYFNVMNGTQSHFETEFAKHVKKTDDVNKQKKGFLKFLKENNLENMLDLYEKDTITNIWEKLTLNTNGTQIVEEPCN